MRKGQAIDVERRRRSVLRSLCDGPQTTASIAAAAEATRGQIYGDCRLLEALGWVESALVQGPVRLFFCPQCGRVVTERNYSGCEGTMRPFFPRVRRWTLTDTGRGLMDRAGDWADPPAPRRMKSGPAVTVSRKASTPVRQSA
jgi:hypothetical protein